VRPWVWSRVGGTWLSSRLPQGRGAGRASAAWPRDKATLGSCPGHGGRVELGGWWCLPGAVPWHRQCPRPRRVASSLDSSLKGQYQVTVEAQDSEAPVHTAQTTLNVSVTPVPPPRDTLPGPAHPCSPHADLCGGSELPHSPPVRDNSGGSPE